MIMIIFFFFIYLYIYQKGATVTDQKVFRDLAAYWEQDFMKDMELLNVRKGLYFFLVILNL